MTEQQTDAINLKDDTPKPPQTPGQMVRAAREAAGLTPQMISEALHLTVHYIKSLEADEYGKLPGLTFVKGYFRAYGRYLRMDVDALMACYERYLTEKGLRQYTHEFNSNPAIGSLSTRRSDQSFAWALVAGVILVIALAAGWWFFGREMEMGLATTAAVTAAPNTTTTTQTPATTTTPAPQQQFNQPSFNQNTISGAGQAPVSNNTAAPQTFAQSFNQTQTTTSTTPQAVTTTIEGDVQAAAADVGAALINATLEARQEEAMLASSENALEAEEAEVTESVEEAVAAVQATVADTNTQIATATQGATPLSSYTAPAANDGTSAAQAVQTAATTAAAVTTENGNGLQIAIGTGGNRNITLRGEGNDRLEIRANGNSWTEVRDARGTDLFSDMLRTGDTLTIQGVAPFAVLLGDARQATASFNAQDVDLSSLIRSDNTARFRLGVEGVTAIVREQTVVAE